MLISKQVFNRLFDLLGTPSLFVVSPKLPGRWFFSTHSSPHEVHEAPSEFLAAQSQSSNGSFERVDWLLTPPIPASTQAL